MAGRKEPFAVETRGRREENHQEAGFTIVSTTKSTCSMLRVSKRSKMLRFYVFYIHSTYQKGERERHERLLSQLSVPGCTKRANDDQSHHLSFFPRSTPGKRTKRTRSQERK